MIWLCTKVNFVYSSRSKNQGMTQGNKTSYTTWWLMLILWHMWNIQPGSTRAFGAMETSRYCEGIDCFHISKCPARANFRFRRVIPVLIKYWYKFTENYFWQASFRTLRLSCLLSGAFCRGFSHIFAFSVCNGPWIVPFGDAFWQTNILDTSHLHIVSKLARQPANQADYMPDLYGHYHD